MRINKLFSKIEHVTLPTAGPNNMPDLNPSIQLLSDTLRVQIYAYSAENQAFPEIMRWPKEVDLTLPQIHLYVEANHVHLITSLPAFYDMIDSRLVCPHCNIKHRGHGLRHLCRAVESCLACRRVMRQSDTFLGSNGDQFCDAKVLYEEQGITTQRVNFEKSGRCKCGLRVLTKSCEEAHGKVCNKVFCCLACDFYAERNGTNRTTQDLRKAHEGHCKQKRCRQCWELSDNPNDHKLHQCKMSQPLRRFTQPRLGFVSFENAVIDLKEEPVMATLLIETVAGQFACRQYGRESAAVVDEQNLIDLGQYWIEGHRPTFSPKKSSHGQDRKSTFKVAAGKESPIAAKLLADLINGVRTETSIIAESSSDMAHLLNAAIILKIEISLTAKEGSLMSITLKSLGYTILNAENYFPCLADISRLYPESQKHFFPAQCLEWFHYIGNGPPPIDKWFAFEDSESTREEKRRYVEQISDERWIYDVEISIASKRRSKKLAVVCLDFLADCFRLQVELLSFGFKNYAEKNPPKTKRQTFYHAFQPPITSRGSFLLSCFMEYSGHEYDLRPLPHENVGHRQPRMSKGEIEFVTYLTETDTENTHINGVSESSQMFFGKSQAIPDDVCLTTRVCSFFQGCFFHGHDCIRSKQGEKERVSLGKTRL